MSWIKSSFFLWRFGASLLSVDGISKTIGERTLIRSASFHVRAGDCIGLVGPNGTGKTTLLRLLMGEVGADSGTMARSRTTRIGYLPQQWSPIEGKSVLAHALDVNRQLQALREELRDLEAELRRGTEPTHAEQLAYRQCRLLEELERLGGYDLEARGRKILAGLGFKSEWLERPVSTLSGGWLMRLELARLLLEEPDLLLLDEPTNHLDLESLLWLESFLLNTRSAVILISHDRAFLNRLVGRVFELEQGLFAEYSGNYDAYVKEKALRRETLLAAKRNQDGQVRQIERFIARNRYRKDRARQVQSRIKTLDRMDQIELAETAATVRFQFPEPVRSGRRVLELEAVDKAYGDYPVYTGVSLVVERGDRIALLGPNGAGKSTLLKVLAGVEAIDRGRRCLGSSVQLGYYAQHQWEQLDSSKTVLEEAQGVAGDLTRSQVRGLLGAFLFRGDEVEKPVAVLSGGEKARLTLVKLLMARPNLLLLDEPTNHLDIASREVLENALLEFAGTLCFISHDREFINAIATKILVIEAGQLHLLPGNYDDFERLWRARVFAAEALPDSAGSPVARSEQGSGPDASGRRGEQVRKRVEAQRRNDLYRLKQPQAQRLRQVEADLAAVHARLDQLSARLADPATYSGGEDIKQLQLDYRQCRLEAERLSRAWEEVSLALEELEQQYFCSSG